MDSKKLSIVDGEHATGSFRPHGRYEGRLEGDVFRMQAVGPFNLEAVVELGKWRREFLRSWKPEGPYAFVVIWHESQLMSPEALRAYGDGFKVYDETSAVAKPCACAWVSDASVEGRSLMEGHFAKLFADAGVPFKNFESEAEAEAWVQAHMARARANKASSAD